MKHVAQVNSVRLLFDPEILKHQADMLLTGSGVKLLYHTVIADTVMAGGYINQVILANKDGLSSVKPKIVIDCTGDADIAAMSGAPFEKADVVQPGTLMFTIGGLEFDDFQAFYDVCRAAMAQAADCGEIGAYTGPSVGWIRPGIINFNNTRLFSMRPPPRASPRLRSMHVRTCFAFLRCTRSIPARSRTRMSSTAVHTSGQENHGGSSANMC